MPKIKTIITGGSTAFVPQSRRINTTSPLAGGGPLSSDLTLTVDLTSVGGDVFTTHVNAFTALNTFAANTALNGDVQISGTGLAYSPLYQGVVGTASRYVTSGELSGGGGSGDMTRTGQNFVTGTPQVYAANVTFTVSGTAQFLGGAYGGTASGANRYLPSGELTTGGGSGDYIKAASNYSTGPVDVWGPTTTVAISGSLSANNTQISGTLIGYGRATDDVLLGGGPHGSVHFRGTGVGATSPIVITVVGSGLFSGRTQFQSLDPNDIVECFNLPFVTQRALVALGDTQVSGYLLAYGNEMHRGVLQASGLLHAYAPVWTNDTQISGTLIGYTTWRKSGTSADGVTFGSSRGVGIAGEDTSSISLSITGSGALQGPFSVIGLGPRDTFSIADMPLILTTTATLVARGGTQISGAFLAYGPLYQGVVGTTTRYVTSGELSAGDYVKASDNYSTGTVDVWGPTTTVAISGMLSANNTQISGALRKYANANDRVIFGDAINFDAYQAFYGTRASASLGWYLGGSGQIHGDVQFTSIDQNKPFNTVNFSSLGFVSLTVVPLITDDVQISGTVGLTYVPLQYRSTAGANRYLTSGELSTGGGTGDYVKASPNYSTGTVDVWGPTTTVAISGMLQANAVQISGALRTYGNTADRFVIGATPVGTLKVGVAAGPTAEYGLHWTGSGYFEGRQVFVQQTGFPSDAVTFSAIPVDFSGASTGVSFGTTTPVRMLGDVQVSGTQALFYAPIAGDPNVLVSGAPVNIVGGPLQYGFTAAGGANRYLPSGELNSAGSGDFIKGAGNYVTGTPQVFGPSTITTFSGLTMFGSAGGTRISATGDVQASGVLLVYNLIRGGQLSPGILNLEGGANSVAALQLNGTGPYALFSPATPVYAGTTAGGARFLTSGELSAAGSLALSSLTAAVATNTINNASNRQTWHWNFGSSGTDGLVFVDSGTTSGASSLLRLTMGSGSAATGLRIDGPLGSDIGVNGEYFGIWGGGVAHESIYAVNRYGYHNITPLPAQNTAVTDDDISAVQISTDIAPSGASASTFEGLRVQLDTQPSHPYNISRDAAMTAGKFITGWWGAAPGMTGGLIGVWGQAYHAGTGTVSSGTGVLGDILHFGTSSSIINTAFNFRAANPIVGFPGSTINTLYQLFLPSGGDWSRITKGWGIYQAQPAASNYLAGNTSFAQGVAVAGPLVAGDLQISGTSIIYGLSNAQRVLNRSTTFTQIVNSTAPVVVYSFTVPSGTLTAGSSLRLHLVGSLYNNGVATTPAIAEEIRFGSTVLVSGNSSTVVTGADPRLVLLDHRFTAISQTRQVADTTLEIGAVTTVSGGAPGTSLASTSVGGNVFCNESLQVSNLLRVNLAVTTADPKIELDVYAVQLEVLP